EIKVRAQNFDSVEYSFIPRQGYSAAHTLAVECWRFEGPRVWIEEALVVVETEADRDQREQIERNKEKCHRLWIGIGARVLLRYGGTWVLKNG
ncbi:hypothetical protein Gorai_022333, partial [Gossypium raimondii]|nr:hypothetical protein [Gossypium raimondii]